MFALGLLIGNPNIPLSSCLTIDELTPFCLEAHLERLRERGIVLDVAVEMDRQPFDFLACHTAIYDRITAINLTGDMGGDRLINCTIK